MSEETTTEVAPSSPRRELLTVEEAAELLQVGTRTVYRHLGKMRVKIGKLARYRRADIEALIKGGEK